MSTLFDNRPLPVRPAPVVLDDDLAPLLSAPFDAAWRRAAPTHEPALRQRLMARVHDAQRAHAAMFTVRRRSLPVQTPARGVQVQTLYAARAGLRLRPGEPTRARLIELAPGATLPPEALRNDDGVACQREWLVVAGRLRVGEESLALRDYHLEPAGRPLPELHSDEGATVFLRESVRAAPAGQALHSLHTLRDGQAGWSDFAPGVRRRVLSSHDGQAAMLYHTDPGAVVPLHSHGHDEECLVLQGDLFLDDVLLQRGDYQLASAGTGHHVTHTDTGVVIYAHGDLDLQFLA